jgi:hypothetical protein
MTYSDKAFVIPPKARLLALVMIAVGFIALAAGFFIDSSRTWTSVLLNNFYFLSIALGAMFFISLQYVTESGWSAMFRRVPEAMAWFIPAAFIFMLILFPGIREIYQWAEPGIAERDALIAHKSPYLNVPFYYIRLLILFGAWTILLTAMRRFSLREDAAGGLEMFNKSRFYSRVFIFVFAVTFSVASFDWIMSIDAHWFSTLFGLRAIISSLYYAVALIVLLVVWLNHTGYLTQLNKYHLNDFARYLFRLSIVWGYLWFIQFFIIWYANIPETTFYYYYRTAWPWSFFFYAELIINWTIPFLVLMSDDLARKKVVLVPVSILLLIGFYISLYLQIMPGSTGEFNIGLVEIGGFAGFGGLFLLFFMYALSRASLVPVSHPYLQESFDHHL